MTHWIKCSDRMPDFHKPVLVARGSHVVCSRWINGWGKNAHKLYWEGYASAGSDYFRYWTPIPEPPKDNT